MSVAAALRAARDAGVCIAIDGDNLILESSAPPPVAVVDQLSRHKAEILALMAATAFESSDDRLRPSLPLRESVTRASIVEPLILMAMQPW